MNILDAATLLLVLAALIGVINHHIFKLPFAIGMLLGGLLGSVGVIVVDHFIPDAHLSEQVTHLVHELDFADTLLKGMLSLLLFAGALHTDLDALKAKKQAIFTLASVGVLISAAITGLLIYWALGLFGLHIDLIWCFAFGALISPTDPIAVLGIMKQAKAPRALETKVIGESLFNDGTGVVLFTLLVGIGTALQIGGADAAKEAASFGQISVLLGKEILGGFAIGLGVGYLAYLVFKTVDDANLEVLISVATIFLINYLSLKVHASAPLAAVTAGLFLGVKGRQAMSPAASDAHDTVWTFLDETLNAILFLLIGVEVFDISLAPSFIGAGAFAILLVLVARFSGVFLPVLAFRMKDDFPKGTITVLTWGGLKGGVSVALAMSLPSTFMGTNASGESFIGRELILTMTYIVVVFSILIQGLTVGPMIKRLFPRPPGEVLEESSHH